MKKLLAILLAAMTVMSVPAFAANVTFTADAEWNVTATGDAADAQVILAVYDAEGKLVEVKLGGTSATIAAASYVNNDDYTLRYFVWDGVDKQLTPYERIATDVISLAATAYTDNVKLEWTHIKTTDNNTYTVWCDDAEIATVTGGAYMHGIAPGNHTYYVT